MQARLLLKASDATFPTLSLSLDTMHYLKDVLRLGEDDSLTVIVENDASYDCKIDSITKRQLHVSIQNSTPLPNSTGLELTIIQSLVKQDKLKTILNTCTQANTTHFIPVETARSVAKISNIEHKLKRWEDILYSASLQSQRHTIPTLSAPQTFTTFLESFSCSEYDLCLVPWEDELNTSLKQILTTYPTVKKIAVFIGPEGGFDTNEIQQLHTLGFQSVSLGSTILRTEHAGFYTLGMIHYALD